MIFVCRQLSSLSPLAFATLRKYNRRVYGSANVRQNSALRRNFTYPPNVGLIGRAKGHLDGVFKKRFAEFREAVYRA